MSKSGYVLASFDTLTGIIHRFMLNRKGRWQNNFTIEQISNFFKTTIDGFLHSYGQEFPNKKTYDDYNKKYTKFLKKYLETGILSGSQIYIDSGGFQVSIGRLTKQECEILIKLYYDWVKENHNLIDKFFILDIPPGPGCQVFENFEQIYEKNLQTYLLARDLEPVVRRKCIYIHHFRTPKLWEIYNRILNGYELFDYFQFHGTGGVVANLDKDTTIPVILYILPLIPLLNKCKKYNRTFLNFHILGGSNYRDVLFYKLFERVVKDKHNIDLKITFDSTGIYKQTMFSRFMYILAPDKNIRKLHLKESEIDKRFIQDVTVYEMFQNCLDELAEFANFKKINIDGIYEKEGGMLHEDVKVYTLLYALFMYDKIEKILSSFANNAIPFFYDDQIDIFDELCLLETIKINQGKVTKKQTAKSHYISESLKRLIELDEEYCEYVVNKYLSKDEFIYLDSKQSLLTI